MTAAPLLALALAVPTQAPKADTPESAFRSFLVAMAFKDDPALRALVLPTDDFDWLLKGEAPPAGQAKAVRESIEKMPIRALKAGDKIEIPVRGGKREMTVQPDEVNDSNAVLLPEGAPIPTRLKKVDGRWRVDARPVIAGRKAAEAARQQKKKSGKAER
jgi:hypothetical protein